MFHLHRSPWSPLKRCGLGPSLLSVCASQNSRVGAFERCRKFSHILVYYWRDDESKYKFNVAACYFALPCMMAAWIIKRFILL